jgi:hypothetical protein
MRSKFPGIFFGSKFENSKKIPVESWPAQKFLARKLKILKIFRSKHFRPGFFAIKTFSRAKIFVRKTFRAKKDRGSHARPVPAPVRV